MIAVDQGQAHALLIPLADSAVLPLFGVTFQTAAEVRPVSAARQICGTLEPSSRGMRHSFRWLCEAPREESGFRKLKTFSQYRRMIA